MICRALELSLSNRLVPLPKPGARCNNCGGAAWDGSLKEGYPGPCHQQDAVPACACPPPSYLPRAGAVTTGSSCCPAWSWLAVPRLLPQVSFVSEQRKVYVVRRGLMEALDDRWRPYPLQVLTCADIHSWCGSRQLLMLNAWIVVSLSCQLPVSAVQLSPLMQAAALLEWGLLHFMAS